MSETLHKKKIFIGLSAPGLSRVLFAVLLWCQSSGFFEGFGKIGKIVITHSGCNQTDGKAGILQQPLGLMHSLLHDKFLEGATCIFVEQLGKILFIQM